MSKKHLRSISLIQFNSGFSVLFAYYKGRAGETQDRRHNMYKNVTPSSAKRLEAIFRNYEPQFRDVTIDRWSLTLFSLYSDLRHVNGLQWTSEQFKDCFCRPPVFVPFASEEISRAFADGLSDGRVAQ